MLAQDFQLPPPASCSAARWAASLGIAAIWTCGPGAAWYLGLVLGRGVVGGWLGFVGETVVGAALPLVALDPRTLARQRLRPAVLRPCMVMP